MNAKELTQERVELFRSCINFKKTERIPHFANVVTWKIFDSGYTIDQAMTDFNIMEKCVRYFLDNYPVDCIVDVGIRNQFNVTDTFDKEGAYYYYTQEAVGVKDHANCSVDTLMDYLNDPEKYSWEVILPKKYGPGWEGKDLSVWKATFSEYMKYIKFILHMSSVMKEYSLPSLSPSNPMKGSIIPAMEKLMSDLLGIEQLSLAMRRYPDKLLEFIDGWNGKYVDPMLDKVVKGKGPDHKYCFDTSILLLAHTIMSTRQYEKFYWPHFKKVLDTYENKSMNVRLFTEGEIMRFTDFFSEYKKGTLTFHLEQDDPFEFRRKCPDIAIMGGMSTVMLTNDTPEECVRYAGKLCDELGKDGGYIFSENKMLSYRNDAKRENMKAVCEFLNSYRRDE